MHENVITVVNLCSSDYYLRKRYMQKYSLCELCTAANYNDDIMKAKNIKRKSNSRKQKEKTIIPIASNTY